MSPRLRDGVAPNLWDEVMERISARRVGPAGDFVLKARSPSARECHTGGERNGAGVVENEVARGRKQAQQLIAQLTRRGDPPPGGEHVHFLLSIREGEDIDRRSPAQRVHGVGGCCNTKDLSKIHGCSIEITPIGRGLLRMSRNRVCHRCPPHLHSRCRIVLRLASQAPRHPRDGRTHRRNLLADLEEWIA